MSPVPEGTGIAWDVTLPADSSNASAADDQIRSDMTAIQSGLTQFLYWDDGSANSDGEWKANTLRWTSVVSTLNVRNATNAAGWLVASQPSPHASGGAVFEGGGLYHAGDSPAELIGHAAMQEHSPLPTTMAARWMVCTGSYTQSATSVAGEVMDQVVTYGVTYTGPVRVFTTVQPNASTGAGVPGAAIANEFINGVAGVSDTTFLSRVSWIAGNTVYFDSDDPTITVHWLSEGTVVYG